MMRHKSLTMWIISALFAAIIGILAQITIPLPLIPITGQTFAIGLTVTILGLRYGTLSVFIYILLGAIGMPVFSAMSGGFGILFGPTGGYILGFLPAAFVIGYYLERFGFTTIQAIIANLLGMIVTLLFGTVWLKYGTGLTWHAAFLGGTVPFLLIGIVKAVASSYAGITVRNRLLRAKLLPSVPKTS